MARSGLVDRVAQRARRLDTASIHAARCTDAPVSRDAASAYRIQCNAWRKADCSVTALLPAAALLNERPAVDDGHAHRDSQTRRARHPIQDFAASA